MSDDFKVWLLLTLVTGAGMTPVFSLWLVACSGRRKDYPTAFMQGLAISLVLAGTMIGLAWATQTGIFHSNLQRLK